MKKNSVKIGISLGDPAGVGPEVIVRAINELRGVDVTPVICGRYDVMARYYPDYIKDYFIIEHPGDLQDLISPGKKYFLDIPSENAVPAPGQGSRETGHDSKIYIDKAAGLWKDGIVDAIVTGPVNKGFIEREDFHFAGHTEYIAELIDEKEPYMMMYSKSYRVLLVTTHIPICEVPHLLDEEKIYRTILTGHRSIKAIDGEPVKMAICGLDPHCGDRGAIGNFDDEITENALNRAREEGINIEGPFAADTLFMPEKWKSYNLVVAQYHDQGLIPFKALAFESGVNVTLGLSIIRTSPDHGTAYDIAGSGTANHKSMLEAIVLARSLVIGKREGRME